MKALSLKSISFRKRHNYVKGTSHKVFQNLLNRDFTAPKKYLKCLHISTNLMAK